MNSMGNYSIFMCFIYGLEEKKSQNQKLSLPFARGGGGGVLPYMGYIGMCGPKGYSFSAVLVINRVSISADFGHFGHK